MRRLHAWAEDHPWWHRLCAHRVERGYTELLYARLRTWRAFCHTCDIAWD
ncbi:hypothetical protein SEA_PHRAPPUCCINO_173 [Mycobacterium phage Phrappuccino]|uniref:Uncharacterized protein n=1 Tax=Mycobacterium phage Phrappuccino TaxID=2591223 RepID=A0A514DE23_9CAUD|nr:hypothetical protein KHQ87_gp173 [Mycobacterium phage Phrappuccino]QDH91848.1 hypothetical protein SEA_PHRAPPUCCINO_173 [Mycobacterium phage Phrappuccino]QIQ63289.1 hypothetical protein SEA_SETTECANDELA_173 [Mycobacterium phage Settecandela]